MFFQDLTTTGALFIGIGEIVWPLIGLFVALTASPLPKDRMNRFIVQTMIWAGWPLYLVGRGFVKLYKRTKQFIKNRHRSPKS